jgi:glycosyltransferase involved in cell wall biosynthesis
LLALRAAVRLVLRCTRCHGAVLHVHAACRGSYARKAMLSRLGKLLGARTVLHVHGADFDEWYRGSGPRGQERIRRFLKRADAVIAVSDYWNRFLSDIAGRSVETVRNTVDAEAFPRVERDRRSSTIKLLFLGLVSERKGAFELLKALRRALDAPAAPDLKLVLAGNGELEKARALVRELDLAGHVEIPGWIGPEEKLRRLAEADVFVLPTRHEGLPMAMLEAMSTGLPVITTPVGGIPEVVRDGETGLLVDPGNAAALAEAMARLSADPDLRHRLGAAAAAEVRSFDLEAACARIKQTYLRVANPH